MQELVERDKKIVSLQNEVRDLREVNEESVNHTYYGNDALSIRGNQRLGSRKLSKNSALY
jgi:hypothetical protein